MMLSIVFGLALILTLFCLRVHLSNIRFEYESSNLELLMDIICCILWTIYHYMS